MLGNKTNSREEADVPLRNPAVAPATCQSRSSVRQRTVWNCYCLLPVPVPLSSAEHLKKKTL